MCLEYFNTCQHLSCNNDYFCAMYFNMHPVSFVWIKSCSNSNNFSLCICAKYQLFFLSIVISFQSKCLFLLTIMTTNHNPLVVYRHHTTGELWYIVYTTEYTTNHNPLVYRHLTTGELWYNVYTTEYTTNHNPLVVYRHLTTGELWYNVYTTEYTTNHKRYNVEVLVLNIS